MVVDVGTRRVVARGAVSGRDPVSGLAADGSIALTLSTACVLEVVGGGEVVVRQSVRRGGSASPFCSPERRGDVVLLAGPVAAGTDCVASLWDVRSSAATQLGSSGEVQGSAMTMSLSWVSEHRALAVRECGTLVWLDDRSPTRPVRVDDTCAQVLRRASSDDSPDGSTVCAAAVTGSAGWLATSSTLQVPFRLDAADPSVALRRPPPPDDCGSGANSARVRGDGRLAALAGWDGAVRLYTTKAPRLLATLDFHRKAARAVCFLDTDTVGATRLATVGEDGDLAIWDCDLAPQR
jgi:WD40 repeat protein